MAGEEVPGHEHVFKLALVRCRIGAATAVLAITVIGCSGPPADQTDNAGPATTQAVGAPLVRSQRPEQPFVAPFQGLPPEAAPPSTPVTGELIQAKLHSQGADTDPLVRCHAPLAFGSIDTVARPIENEKGAWQGSFTNIKYPDSTTIVSDRARGRGCLQGADGPVGVDKSQAVGVRLGCPGLIIEGEVPVAPEPYLGQ